MTSDGDTTPQNAPRQAEALVSLLHGMQEAPSGRSARQAAIGADGAADAERPDLPGLHLLLERLLGLLDEAVLIVGPDGTVAVASAGFARLTRRDTASVVGRPLGDIVHESDRARLGHDLARALAGEWPPAATRSIRTDGGGLRASVRILGTGRGGPAAAIVVPPRPEGGAMLSTVVSDPEALAAESEIAARISALDARAAAIGRATSQIERLVALIDTPPFAGPRPDGADAAACADRRTVDRCECGVAAPQVFELDRLARRAVRWVGRSRRTAPEIRLLAAMPVPAMGRPGQILRVVLMLVQDSLDAMEGRPDQELAVEVRAEGDRALLELRDTGPMAAARWRGPGGTRQPPSLQAEAALGRALSTSLRILQRHGGGISLGRRAGGGGFCRITLPAPHDA